MSIPKNVDPKKSTPNDLVYLFFSPQISDLEGKLLTLIDASIQDPIQRKALKDILRQNLWSWMGESNMSEMYEVDLRKDIKKDITSSL